MSTLAVTIPEIDYKGLSPLFAIVGGSILVLMVGLFRGRFVQTILVPLLGIAALGAAIGLTIWIWEPGVRTPIVRNGTSTCCTKRPRKRPTSRTTHDPPTSANRTDRPS